MSTKEKRKTYSLDPDRARDLGRAALQMGETLNRTVNRQDILDELVSCLVDKKVYRRVLNAIHKA